MDPASVQQQNACRSNVICRHVAVGQPVKGKNSTECSGSLAGSSMNINT